MSYGTDRKEDCGCSTSGLRKGNWVGESFWRNQPAAFPTSRIAARLQYAYPASSRSNSKDLKSKRRPPDVFPSACHASGALSDRVHPPHVEEDPYSAGRHLACSWTADCDQRPSHDGPAPACPI